MNRSDIVLVSKALDRAEISHRPLRQGLDANNLAFTDDFSVWVKLARQPGTYTIFATEIAAAEAAAAAGTATVIPLRGEPLKVDDRFGSVWKYVPHTRIRPDQWTVPLAYQVWDAVLNLHSTQPPEGTPHVESLEAKVASRLRHNYADLQVADQLLWLAQQVSTQWDSAVATGQTVWCHGDVHAGNILLTDDTVVLADWETTVVAPAEWDVAGLYHNMVCIGGREDVWNTVLPMLGRHDADLLVLTVWVKTISGAAYLLQFSDTAEILHQRLDALTSAVDTGTLPGRLAAHPGR